MTKKDYVLIAAVLNAQLKDARSSVEHCQPKHRNSWLARESAVHDMISAFNDKLTDENERFSAATFLKACLSK